MSYRYYNANPFKNHTVDCTARAISVLEGVDWGTAYDRLSKSAKNMGLMMSDVEAIEEYLDMRYNRVPIEEETVGEFVENHPIGKYVITMPNHITSLVDSIIYDTFDPREKPIWSAWTTR